MESAPATALAPDAEAVFARFVRNANEVGRYARTLRVSLQELLGEDEPLPLVRRIQPLPLTRRKTPAEGLPRPSLESLDTTEGSEDGMVPPRLLERVLGDLDVALRFGHRTEVQPLLEALLQRYPRDLLLLRRVAELHLGHGDLEEGKQCLARLAGALFERGQHGAAEETVAQIRALDPTDQRLARLEALLRERHRRGEADA